MSLQRLAIQHFRNLTAVSLNLHPKFNIFYGENGSGKTSLLEAIHFLGLGRSFRSHLVKTYIQDEQPSCTVFGLINLRTTITVPVAIEKFRDGKTLVKVNGNLEQSAAEIAKLLPVQLINQDSFYLLSGGPKNRRQFIDWGVFHVEPNFYSAWQRFQRSLKQRNAVLKQESSLAEITLWDREFTATGQAIAEMRKHYIDQLQPIFNTTLAQLNQAHEVELSYYPGWDDDQPLADILTRALLRDKAIGYTQYGPHRADLRIRVGKTPAQEVLSRGQQKMLVSALRLAQGVLLQQLIEKNCIYLIDDLPAELDKKHRQSIMAILANLNSQVFITGIELAALKKMTQLPCQLFHVKQGDISPERD